MVEILAPAGNMESLRAAVLNGAGAVYIGGKEFSARQFAGNFDREEMIEAVRFCHSYNVKVYVTMNTLYRNNELNGVLKYAAYLYSIGVDAVIIQDIGFLKLLKEYLPYLEVHGSTQMTAHNLDGVNLLYNMGVKRVVLSRELNLEEIRYIVKNTKAEIEVFVHGALCISFSGQCLFSSMIGGRSGNRGRCAQPCRMEYEIDGGEKAHHLSPKDLSTLEFIDEIVKSGVHSLKIEGRMKRPEYVATVVSAYKRAIEGNSIEDDIEKVTQVFNRGGFTSHHLLGKSGREMMSLTRPKNWGTYLGKVVSAKGKFASIHLEKSLSLGDGVEIFNKNMGAPVGKIILGGSEVEEAKKGDIVTIYLEGAKKNDVIYKSLDAKLVREAEESYKGRKVMRMPLRGSFRAKKGEKISFKIENIHGIFSEGFEDEPEKALKTPTSIDRVMESLSKTKDTPFYFENLDIEMDEDIVIPVSKINSLRRQAIEGLIDKLQEKREYRNIELEFKRYPKEVKLKLCVKTGSMDAAKAAINGGAEIVYFGGDRLRINRGTLKELLEYSNGKAKVFPWYPEIIIEEYDLLKNEAVELKKMGIDSALCGNLGFYSFLWSEGFEVYLDKGFNVFNSKGVETFENRGALLSQELNFRELKDLVEKTQGKTIVNVHGRVKLMVSRHCSIGSAMGHGKEGCPNLCKNEVHYLKDRLGEEVPVITDFNCRSHIYSHKILCTIEHIKDIINLETDYILVNLVDETFDEAGLAVSAYRDALDRGLKGDFTMGDMGRKLTESLKGNIMKGHFLKGVE